MMNLRIHMLVFVPIAFTHPLDEEQARSRSLSSTVARNTQKMSFLTSKAIITPTSPAWALELKHRATLSLDTCGYISGEPNYPVTCNPSYRCIIWKTYSVAGCCDTRTDATDCIIPTTCVPYNAYQSCATCVKESLATTCSSSASPFCSENHYLYGEGLTLTEYGCETTSTTEIIFPSLGRSPTPRSTPTASPSLTIPASQPTITGGNSVGSMPTDFNLGAAVGGVIGGFIVLAVLTFGAWSKIRKKKQKATTSPPSRSVAVQPTSMSEAQNVATTAATPTVSHIGHRVLVPM